MSAPLKPWEGTNQRVAVAPALYGPAGPLHSSGGQMPPAAPLYRRAGRVAPPIPSRVPGSERPSHRHAYPRIAAYGPGVYGGGAPNPYGTGYGGVTPYAGYGPAQMYGGYGMNRYPQQGMGSLESRFIQLAEENSRPAFESIESLVHAFGSVNFMMESTFHAMYSSFRAVLGVAENFGRLRSLFGQVFQTFAVLRMFQWAYRKLLYYLGIRQDNPGREAVWKEATGQLDPKTRRTFWPVAMFLGLVCGGPFLVWRLLKSISNMPPPVTDSVTSPRAWMTNGSVTLPVGVALYDFTAVRENELTMKVGQPLFVAPAQFQTPESDWVLITLNWKESGLVPANFIQVMEHRKYVKPKPKQVPGVAKQSESPAVAELPEIPMQGARTDVAVERLGETPAVQPPPTGQHLVQNQGPLPHQPAPIGQQWVLVNQPPVNGQHWAQNQVPLPHQASVNGQHWVINQAPSPQQPPVNDQYWVHNQAPPPQHAELQPPTPAAAITPAPVEPEQEMPPQPPPATVTIEDPAQLPQPAALPPKTEEPSEASS